MDNHIAIRSLQPADVPLMHQAFLDAFSDYPLEFSMNEEMFRKKFVEKLNINFELSGGAFVNGTMIGFIFTSVNRYEGKLTAYNGGTGIIPQHRGANLTVRIYDFLIKKFKTYGIAQCVLEALASNRAAIRVYEKTGFRKSKSYRCFRLSPSKFNDSKVNPQAVIATPSTPDWNTYRQFVDHSPSFLDQEDLLNKNLRNEVLLEARHEGVCVGYCFYQKDIGRISQIGVQKSRRRMGFGSALLSYVMNHSRNKFLTVLNVNNKNADLKKFLKKIGFENKVNQYEMILTI